MNEEQKKGKEMIKNLYKSIVYSMMEGKINISNIKKIYIMLKNAEDIK